MEKVPWRNQEIHTLGWMTKIHDRVEIPCWMELSLMSIEFGNDKGISDDRESNGISDSDGKKHERI